MNCFSKDLNRKRFGYLLSAWILSVALLLSGGCGEDDSGTYESGLSFMEDGNWAAAESTFAEIPGYQDSDSLLVVCSRHIVLDDFISRGHHPGLEYSLGASREGVEEAMGAADDEYDADGGNHVFYELPEGNVSYGFPHIPDDGKGNACSRLLVGGSLAQVLGRSMQDVLEIAGEPVEMGYSEYYQAWTMYYELEGCNLVLEAQSDTADITMMDMMRPN